MLITENEFHQKINTGEFPVIVSFGASWSGNAEMLFIMLQDLDDEFEGQVDLCLADVEDNRELAEQYGISEVPTTLIINNGEVVDFFAGMISKGRIRSKIESCLVF